MQQQGWMSCIEISSEGMETKQGIFEELLYWNCIEYNLGMERRGERDRQTKKNYEDPLTKKVTKKDGFPAK